jgi:hypothetical protein
MLATYPDCTVLYTGQYDGDSIYIVGRNTEFEKLFNRQDLAAATTYAIETGQQIENIPNTGLCAQAVLDVYALV